MGIGEMGFYKNTNLKHIKVRNESPFNLPQYETSGASGFDLLANLTGSVALEPKDRFKVPTGLYFQIPDGYEMQIRSRSGLAFNHGIVVLNSPGTVDSDYRGEVCVILANLGYETYIISPGDRIAQGVICPVSRCVLEEGALNETDRGSGGFGSTGTK